MKRDFFDDGNFYVFSDEKKKAHILDEEEEEFQVPTTTDDNLIEKLSPDLRELILTLEVGVLFQMAKTNKFFAAFGRNDGYWKRMFIRDFPKEFQFCGGILPAFVITEDSPFYKPGMIDERDKSGWKRFYLHTRQDYIGMLEFVEEPVSNFKSFKDVYDRINIYFNTLKEENFDSNKSKHNHIDYRIVLAWRFIIVVAHVLNWDNVTRLLLKDGIKSEDDPTRGSNKDARMIVNNYITAKNASWLRKYLVCSMWDDKNNLYYNITDRTLKDIFDKLYLIPSITWYFDTLNLKDDVDNYDQMKTEIFSEDGTFIMDELSDNPVQRTILKLHYDWLQRCYHNVCLFSFNRISKKNKHIHALSFICTTTREMLISKKFSIHRPMLGTIDYDTPFGFIFNVRRNGIYKLITKYSSAPRLKYVPGRDFFNDFRRENRGKILFMEKCITCNTNRATYKCANCNGAVYCGEKCQKEDWYKNGHDKTCVSIF